jgi:hypothetical protein
MRVCEAMSRRIAPSATIMGGVGMLRRQPMTRTTGTAPHIPPLRQPARPGARGTWLVVVVALILATLAVGWLLSGISLGDAHATPSPTPAAAITRPRPPA